MHTFRVLTLFTLLSMGQVHYTYLAVQKNPANMFNHLFFNSDFILFIVEEMLFIYNFLIIIMIMVKLRGSSSQNGEPLGNLTTTKPYFQFLATWLKLKNESCYSIFDVFRMKIYLKIYIFQIFDVESVCSLMYFEQGR